MTTATLDAPAATNVPAKAAPLSSIPGPAVGAPATTPASAPAATEAVNASSAETQATTVTPPASPAKLLADVADPATAPKDAPPAEVAGKAESYELKAPDGAPLSADDVKAIQTFAVENGLTKAQAEKVLAREVAGRAAAKTAQEAEVTKVAETWRAQAEKQFGAKLDATVADAKRALLAFASADERKAIASSPFANNPMFLGILARAAQALPVEDTAHLSTATPSRADSDAAHSIYAGFGKR